MSNKSVKTSKEKSTKSTNNVKTAETKLTELYKMIEIEKENTIKYIKEEFPSVSAFITSFITDFYNHSVISLKFYVNIHQLFSIEIKVEKQMTDENNIFTDSSTKEIILVPTGITTTNINITTYDTITQKADKITEYNFLFSYLEYKICKNIVMETKIIEYLKSMYNRLKESFTPATVSPVEIVPSVAAPAALAATNDTKKISIINNKGKK